MSAVEELVTPRASLRFRADGRSQLAASQRPTDGRADAKLSDLPDDLGREVYCVLGIPIDVVEMSEALRRIEVAAALAKPYLISTPNLNFLINSRDDAEFRESIIESDLCPPDGMPIIWIARMMGLPIRQRVAGSDIFDCLKRQYSLRPLKTFLFGGAAGVAGMVAQALNAKPLGLSCVGSLYPGYGTIDLMSSDEVLDTINASKADFLAVALSAAKGQAWLYRNRRRLQVPVRAQLGAAINFQAGTLRRAPQSIQKLGLEWLWRIKEEPHLWKRYAHDGLSLLQLLFVHVLPIAMMGWWRRLSSAAHNGNLIVECSQSAGTAVVSFSGHATDLHIEQATARLREVLASNQTIVVDLSQTRTIDARFLGLLLMARKVAAIRGSRLIITRVSSQIRRLFRINGAEFLLSSDEG